MNNKKGNKTSCQCDECRGSCEYKSGWMKFGEAEKIADYLKISIKELFDKYLNIDWYENSSDLKESDHNGDTFVLAPSHIGQMTGEEAPYRNLGTCIFFKDGKCSIHAVKPFECAEAIHDSENDENIHKETASSWLNHQNQIKELLGRKPYPTEGHYSELW